MPFGTRGVERAIKVKEVKERVKMKRLSYKKSQKKIKGNICLYEMFFR
jgi:hypothetical protein